MGEQTESDIPSTREILGVHLYQKVIECTSNLDSNHGLPEKLTGMLMESTTTDLFCMLQDRKLLQRRLNAAQACLGDNTGLGTRLYDDVLKLETALCSQITGMLLELDRNTVEDLIEDSSKLEHAISKSKAAILCQHKDLEVMEEEVCKEEIGEKMYEYVESIYPEEAARITGMLLEIDLMALRRLLDDKTHLRRTIDIAKQALQNHSSQSS